MKSVSMKAWRLGKKISVDEQTIGFQGRHALKLRITYKKEGNGFQCDALCDDGYTFIFFFHHDPPPKQYTNTGLSPLHSRVMNLFDGLSDQYHECGVDNLYMSAKFCKDAFNHPMKVKLHGVTRKGGRGLPNCVLQDEKTNQKEQEKVRGTVCAAELVGDITCPSLIAVSVYDTKPVHFLTMAVEKIFWEEKSKEVYDKEMKRMKQIKFLRLNVNDDYNYGMGGADIADQIRGSYCFDHWVRNFKWWHSIFWWGVHVLMVNAYRCYVRHLLMNGLTPMSHYEFQCKIARVWLDKDYYSKQSGEGGFRRSSSLSTSMSDISSCASHESKRKTRMSESGLHPFTGALKSRLNRTLGHWPCAPSIHHPTIKSNCQLHLWATGKRKYKDVVYCADCNTSLCTDNCFEIFHTEWDLGNKKDMLREKYECKIVDDED